MDESAFGGGVSGDGEVVWVGGTPSVFFFFWD